MSFLSLLSFFVQLSQIVSIFTNRTLWPWSWRLGTIWSSTCYFLNLFISFRFVIFIISWKFAIFKLSLIHEFISAQMLSFISAKFSVTLTSELAWMWIFCVLSFLMMFIIFGTIFLLTIFLFLNRWRFWMWWRWWWGRVFSVVLFIFFIFLSTWFSYFVIWLFLFLFLLVIISLFLLFHFFLLFFSSFLRWRSWRRTLRAITTFTARRWRSRLRPRFVFFVVLFFFFLMFWFRILTIWWVGRWWNWTRRWFVGFPIFSTFIVTNFFLSLRTLIRTWPLCWPFIFYWGFTITILIIPLNYPPSKIFISILTFQKLRALEFPMALFLAMKTSFRAINSISISIR